MKISAAIIKARYKEVGKNSPKGRGKLGASQCSETDGCYMWSYIRPFIEAKLTDIYDQSQYLTEIHLHIAISGFV
jgi:hypothetical protein